MDLFGLYFKNLHKIAHNIEEFGHQYSYYNYLQKKK